MLHHAKQSDLEPLLAFLKANKLVLEGVKEHLQHFFVRLEDDKITAAGGLEVYGDTALLRSVAVMPQAQGNGTKLVRHLLKYARALGVREVVLLTETAPDFFAKLGFKVVARDDVPEALKVSVEFRGACADSAVAMRLVL